MARTASASHQNKVFTLSIAALGVVYGDIGTSPLYALRESLSGLAITPLNVLGILSLIFWALILIISVKYLLLVLRADNDGEGGILALFALLKRANHHSNKFFFGIAIVGAGLLIGDGMLTPAISVISAMEGLQVISPIFSKFVLPLTVIILLMLFVFQQYGTGSIGRYFGPIILLWFITIGLIGLFRILENPNVIAAINPYYALEFFHHNGWSGYILLGGVFLVVTGGEALYADLGHFGKNPIRLGWFCFALPGLLLNYFGQGAYLLQFPDAIANPFYLVAPAWFSYPLLILATIATIIASQAVISATFSLAKQAVLLDFYPRLPIIQTSEQEKGQIYIPQINFILAIGTLTLVIIFKNSSALAHAYGVAVNLDMLAVTVLVSFVAYYYWRWNILKIVAIFSVFLIIELAFWGANLQKIPSGGWVPLVFALVCAIIMLTWSQGLDYLRSFHYKGKVDLKEIVYQLDYPEVNYLHNTTSVFIADPYDNSGTGLLHYLKLNRIMPEHIIILSITIANHPHVDTLQRYKLTELKKGIYRMIVHYGFMDEINIPHALSFAKEINLFPFKFEIDEVSYLIEIASVIATRRERTLFFFWQEKLFAFLMRNAALDIEFFKLPYNKTMAIGTYCEI